MDESEFAPLLSTLRGAVPRQCVPPVGERAEETAAHRAAGAAGSGRASEDGLGSFEIEARRRCTNSSRDATKIKLATDAQPA